MRGDWNQIVYWSRLVDWKNQTLTPNPDAIYIMPFFDTAQTGPMVLEIPAAGEGSITGSIMDCWQTPLEDVGPAGADKGRGGKYLILPPGYSSAVPEGQIPLPSQTYQGYALFALDLVERQGCRFPQSARLREAHSSLSAVRSLSRPPATTYLDAAGILFDATIPYDARFFESARAHR